MRWLIGLVTALFTLWAGFWVVGSTMAERGIRDALAKAAANGLTAEGEVSVAGFPNRFDVTLDAPHFADAASGWAWKAPFVQILTRSYMPWKTIIALPNEQVLTGPGGEVTLRSARLMSNVNVTPDSTLALDRVIIEGDALALTARAGWQGTTDRLVAGLRRRPDMPASYDLSLDLADLGPDPAFSSRLAAISDLPDRIGSVQAEAVAMLSAPLDRNAGQNRPALVGLTLSRAALTWGTLGIRASGSLTPDALGLASGSIAIDVTGWEALVPVLQASGAVKPELAETTRSLLQSLAAQGSDPKVLSLPLVFKDGWMTLGPLPLGPAPRLGP